MIESRQVQAFIKKRTEPDTCQTRLSNTNQMQITNYVFALACRSMTVDIQRTKVRLNAAKSLENTDEVN